MRILVNAGPWLPVPPGGYGGIETVLATLIPELRRAGVHVTLATVGPSSLEADAYLRPLAEPQFRSIAMPYNQVSGIAHAHMHALVNAMYDGGTWDLVHDHLEVVGPAVFAASAPRTRRPPAAVERFFDPRFRRGAAARMKTADRATVGAAFHAAVRWKELAAVPLGSSYITMMT